MTSEKCIWITKKRYISKTSVYFQKLQVLNEERFLCSEKPK